MDEAQQAFDELKRRFISASLLVYYDLKRRSRIEIDVFEGALGAILTQKYFFNSCSIWHLVAFYSTKMISVETRYTTGD